MTKRICPVLMAKAIGLLDAGELSKVAIGKSLGLSLPTIHHIKRSYCPNAPVWSRPASTFDRTRQYLTQEVRYQTIVDLIDAHPEGIAISLLARLTGEHHSYIDGALSFMDDNGILFQEDMEGKVSRYTGDTPLAGLDLAHAKRLGSSRWEFEGSWENTNYGRRGDDA